MYLATGRIAAERVERFRELTAQSLLHITHYVIVIACVFILAASASTEVSSRVMLSALMLLFSLGSLYVSHRGVGASWLSSRKHLSALLWVFAALLTIGTLMHGYSSLSFSALLVLFVLVVWVTKTSVSGYLWLTAYIRLGASSVWLRQGGYLPETPPPPPAYYTLIVLGVFGAFIVTTLSAVKRLLFSSLYVRERAKVLLDALFTSSEDSLIICHEDLSIFRLNEGGQALLNLARAEHGLSPLEGQQGSGEWLTGEPTTTLAGLMVSEVSSIHTLTAQKSQGSQKRARETRLSELITQKTQKAQRGQRGQHLTHRLAHLELSLGRRLFELSLEPLIIDKLVQGYIITARDVTALRAQQKRAAQAERMDAIGEVTSSVAHDFKNLITSLQGALECAREGASEAQEEWFEIMDLSAKQATTLVRQLLDFARDQPELSRQVSVQVIVQQSTQLIKHALEKNIELKVELPEEELMIFVNQSALINALVNLAINASHAMPQGGALTLQARPLCLAERELGELPQGEYLCLSVQDTGVGIPEEHLELIFEPFFTTKPEGKGTGLGLASTYQLMRRSGGLITVESEVGVGTRFELYLPLYRPSDEVT